MNTIERDVIVIGAGPAGSICAPYLAKAGVDVLLLDKEVFPRDKTCGDMITETVANHVARLEAADKLDKMSVFVNQLLIVVGILMFLLTFCGCIGSLRENICLLQTVSGQGRPPGKARATPCASPS